MKSQVSCLCVLLSGLFFPTETIAQDWATKRELLAVRAELEGKINQNKAATDQLAASIAKITENIQSNTKLIGQIHDDLDSRIVDVTKDGRVTRDELDQISHYDPAAGQRLLSYNMSKETGRQALAEAVRTVTPREGTLTVENRMAHSYRIRVNGSRIFDGYIAPGSSKTFRVPSGTASTELVGYEAAKNWTIAGPDYNQAIVIGPRRTSTVVMHPVNIVSPTVIDYTIGWWAWQYDPLWGWTYVYRSI